jgi:hypothetical protein
VLTKICPICKSLFETNTPKVYCSDICFSKRRRSIYKEKTKQFRVACRAKKIKVPLSKVCTYCGVEFNSLNKQRTFCCKECYKKSMASYKKMYYSQHRERISEKNKRNFQETKSQFNEKLKKRRKADPLFNLACRMRSAVNNALARRGFSKRTTTQSILGCSFEDLYKHLTETFIKNYNRKPNNNDNLHIDHIIPLSSAQSEAEILKLNHYYNLQWLLACDNMKKGTKESWR